MYEYDPELLAALATLGIAPTPQTPPERTKAAVNDLYRYELRRLRDRLVAKDIPKAGYAERVIALRGRYWMLSLPLHVWARRAPHAKSSNSTSV